MAEEIAFAFIGILILGAIALCLSINLYLGLSLLIFSVVVVWWIFGVKKKKVDRAMAELAKDTGLSFNKSLLKYGTVTGKYNGIETEIGVYKDANSFGGMGVIIGSLTGEGALASLNIRNFTGIRMRHDLAVSGSKMISDNDPFIGIDKEWIYLALPHVSEDKIEIKNYINTLYSLANSEQIVEKPWDTRLSS